MIRKTERYYIKRVVTHKAMTKRSFNEYGRQQRKRTTYWLFYIIPIFISDEVVGGDYENNR